MDTQKENRRAVGIDKPEVDVRKRYIDTFKESMEYILRKMIHVPLAKICDDVFQTIPSDEVQTGYVPMDASTVRALRRNVPEQFNEYLILNFTIEEAVSFSIGFAYYIIQKDSVRYKTGFPGVLEYDKDVCETAEKKLIEKIKLIQSSV